MTVILAGRITGEARGVAGESDVENVNKQTVLTILAITLHTISPESDQKSQAKPGTHVRGIEPRRMNVA